MKTIFINALSALQGGGQTYLINLFKYRPKGGYKIYLLAHKRNKEIFLEFQDDDFEILEFSLASGNIIQRVLFEKFKLPNILKKLQIDIYYAPGGIMNIKVPKNCKSVVAFRNMLPLQKDAYTRYLLFSYMRFRIFLLRYIFINSFKKSDKVIFISKYAQEVIKQYIPKIEDKSIVIYHGLNEIFLNEITNNDLDIKLDYYLYVSILDVYKSQIELVRSWKILKDSYGIKEKLLLIGPMYKPYGNKVLNEIQKLNLQDDVIYLGTISYNELPKYYQKAKALIFASICENCPNILLEKMASKKMIFCSSHQPMPEFGKDSVVYFDPVDENDLVKQILKYSDEKQKDKYEIKAYNNALEYDWKKTSKKTFEFLLGN